MTDTLGNYGLMAAFLASMAALVAAVAGGRLQDLAWAGRARVLLAVGAGFLSLCAVVLVAAILGDEFNLDYVAHYSERALPIAYKLAAFWAGQAGSLLLWGWMIAVLGLVAAVGVRKWDAAGQAGVCGTVAVVVAFFAAMMLFIPEANPFSPLLAPDPVTQELVPFTPADGKGLNPMLQNPAMMAHPPILFLGYSGFAVAFALAVGGLLTGRLGNVWLATARRWVLGSWVLLGMGILLGSWWAYVELGWGGYWAWDPVENASLLPWFTGTALLHTMVVQRSRGLFKGLNVGLIALTFLLCVFGTYLTRSGVIQSVHSFGKSGIGTVLLVFLVAMTAASVVLLAWRRKALAPETDATWAWREWVFFTVASVLVGMMFLTVAGTLRPLFSEAVSGARMAVLQEFYNHYVLELLGVPLLAMLAFGPLVAYARTKSAPVGPVVAISLGAAVAAIAVAAALGIRNGFALAAGAIAAGAIAVIVAELIQSVAARARATGEGLPVAVGRLVRVNRARYGAQAAHLGVVMIMLGVVGSSLYDVEEIVSLTEGQSARVGRYTLTLKGLQDSRGVNYAASAAQVEVAYPGGEVTMLRPERRLYDKSESGMVASEIALASSLREDLYLALAGGDEKTSSVLIKVLVKPLLAWIWIGGIFLTVGGLVPRLLPAWRPAPAEALVRPVVRRPAKLESVNSGRHR